MGGIELALLVVAAGALLYWIDGLRARERAVAAARQACLRAQVQFLDDSVIQFRIRLVRNAAGRVQFQRDFRFEFSDTGDNRRPATVRVMGARIEWVDLDGEWQPGGGQVVRLDSWNRQTPE